jgi:hypothetical protein
MAIVKIAILAWAALFFLVGPAYAEAVTSATLCRVQHAIRWQVPAWTEAQCDRVAGALNVTSAPTTFAAIAIIESDLRPRAIAWHGPRVADVGLLGIRCILGERGRCTNGAATGYTPEQLQDAETNIAVANVLWTANGGRLSRWNAGSRDHAANVGAISAALAGVRVPTKSKRVRKLVELILVSVGQSVNRS